MKFSQRRFDILQKEVRNELQRLVNNSIMNGVDAGQMQQHLLMLISDQRGLIKYQYELHARNLEIYERTSKIILDILKRWK